MNATPVIWVSSKPQLGMQDRLSYLDDCVQISFSSKTDLGWYLDEKDLQVSSSYRVNYTRIGAMVTFLYPILQHCRRVNTYVEGRNFRLNQQFTQGLHFLSIIQIMKNSLIIKNIVVADIGKCVTFSSSCEINVFVWRWKHPNQSLLMAAGRCNFVR